MNSFLINKWRKTCKRRAYVNQLDAHVLDCQNSILWQNLMVYDLETLCWMEGGASLSSFTSGLWNIGGCNMSRSDVYFGVGEIHVEVHNLMRCKSEACVWSEGSVKLQSDWGSESDDHNSEVSCLEERGVTFTDLIFCWLADNICSRSAQWNSSLSPACTHACVVRQSLELVGKPTCWWCGVLTLQPD